MELKDEQIAELKKAHGNIRLATIKYKTEDKEVKVVNFVHRKTSFEDYEAFQSDMGKIGVASANLNLITTIKVFSDDDLTQQLSACPVAVDTWLTKTVLPSLGGDIVETTSIAL